MIRGKQGHAQFENRENIEKVPGTISQRQRKKVPGTINLQRYYDPSISAFLSVDPVTAYSNPVGAFNRYRYANNNPYRFTDPDGRCADRYKDGSCRVIVDSATGADGHKAGKQLQAEKVSGTISQGSMGSESLIFVARS